MNSVSLSIIGFPNTHPKCLFIAYTTFDFLYMCAWMYIFDVFLTFVKKHIFITFFLWKPQEGLTDYYMCSSYLSSLNWTTFTAALCI